MNKLTYIAIAASAALSISSVAFAACPTNSVKGASSCLENLAGFTVLADNQAFQKNYNTEYAKQQTNNPGASYYSGSNNNNSGYQNQNTDYAATPAYNNTNNNNNNNNNSKSVSSSIHWF